MSDRVVALLRLRQVHLARQDAHQLAVVDRELREAGYPFDGSLGGPVIVDSGPVLLLGSFEGE